MCCSGLGFLRICHGLSILKNFFQLFFLLCPCLQRSLPWYLQSLAGTCSRLHRVHQPLADPKLGMLDYPVLGLGQSRRMRPWCTAGCGEEISIWDTGSAEQKVMNVWWGGVGTKKVLVPHWNQEPRFPQNFLGSWFQWGTSTFLVPCQNTWGHTHTHTLMTFFLGKLV